MEDGFDVVDDDSEVGLDLSDLCGEGCCSSGQCRCCEAMLDLP